MPTTQAFRLRRSSDKDNEALCELFAGVSMDSDVVLSVDRRPDFHDLYRLQSDDWECWIAEDDERLHGMATVLVRAGYVDGAVTPVGYVGDLRSVPGTRAVPLIGEFYDELLRRVAERSGAQVFLTSVIASNERAVRALTGPGAGRHGIPPYTLLRRFDIRSIHATVSRPARRTGFRVRRAGPRDLDALATFLDADGRSRPYGYVFGSDELQRRLTYWPGLDTRSFLIAEDKSGDMVGCLAVWDAAPVKRTIVRDYRRRMKAVYRGFNWAARVLRFPLLPAPGQPLPYSYITHLAVPDNEPAVLAALLDSAYAELRSSGQCLLSSCVFEDDPLAAAYRGFVTTNLAAHLYGVTPTGHPLPPRLSCFERPGFEMALV